MGQVVAKVSARVGGADRTLVVKGRVYDDTDRVVVAHPDLFCTADEWAKSTRRPRSTEELGERSMSARSEVRGGPEGKAIRQEQGKPATEFPCPRAAELGCARTFGTEQGAQNHANKVHSS